MDVKYYGVPELEQFSKYTDMHYVLEHINNLQEEFLKCSIYKTETEEITFQPYENGQVFYIYNTDKNNDNKYITSTLIIKNNLNGESEINYIISSDFEPRSTNYDMQYLQDKVTEKNDKEQKKIMESLGKKIDVDIFAIGDTKNSKLLYKADALIRKEIKKPVYKKNLLNSMNLINNALKKYPSHESIIEEQKNKHHEDMNEVSINNYQTTERKLITPDEIQYIDKLLKVFNKELELSDLNKGHEIESLDDRLKKLPMRYMIQIVKLYSGEITYEEAKNKIQSYIEIDSDKKVYKWTPEQKLEDLTPEYTKTDIKEEIEETHSRSR